MADDPTSTVGAPGAARRCARRSPANLNTTSIAAQGAEFGRQHAHHRRCSADQFDRRADREPEPADRSSSIGDSARRRTSCSISATSWSRISRSWWASRPRATATARSTSTWATGSRWCSIRTPTLLSTVPNQFNASQLEVASIDLRRQLDLELDHLRGSRRPAGGAHPGHRSGAQSARADRHRGCAERQHAASLGSRPERPAGRESVLRRRAAGDRLERQHRRHDGERHRRPASAR